MKSEIFVLARESERKIRQNLHSGLEKRAL